ncbi:MAG: hypothetical protein EHM89_07790 [Acidobacteria bacterium]|nr:MAG: hypothetical protein EHM89_07790 [Acidobacteriota bacterium]
MSALRSERGSARHVVLATVLILTSILGTGLVVLGTQANNRRAARLAAVERELAEARKAHAETEARFNRALDLANQRSRELERQVDAERENASSAEAELLKLRRRLAPRTLNPNQARIFVAALSGFEGELVTVVTQSGSDETSQFGRQVQAILEKAGLRVMDGDGVPAFVALNGIRLAVGERRPAVAAAIRATLLEAKIADSVTVEPNTNPDELRVMVGARRI